MEFGQVTFKGEDGSVAGWQIAGEARTLYREYVPVKIGTNCGNCVSACNFGSDSLLMKLRRRFAWFRKGISAMPSLHASKLVPPGFSADDAMSDDDSTVVMIHGTSAISACPSCGVVSDRIHSRYPRRLADLPIAGRRVVLERFAIG
jgi:hypothetical protein